MVPDVSGQPNQPSLATAADQATGVHVLASLDEDALPPTVPGGRPSRALPVVPGYEILKVLGQGGMGVVYQARQIQLKRIVALKMILAGAHAGESELARFRTESEAIARLQHPHIVQVHEVGDHAGVPFFSLEFCSGGSLAQKLSGTPLPPKDAAELVEKLARAMHAAHQKDIVHRDLKPANVLLAEGGEPKVTDFGLAKKLDDAGQTRTGAIMGTPSYMAPEQADGRIEEIGPATDVYALGAILYECLTGRPPFKAATLLETLEQVRTREPVSPRSLNPQAPPDLETICLKCMRKQARERFASAAALADDLRRFLDGEPIRARPVGKWERAVKWVRRRPMSAALLAVSAAALLALLAMGGALIVQQSLWNQALSGEVTRANDSALAAETAREGEAVARKEETQRRIEADEARKRAEERERETQFTLYTSTIQRIQREGQLGDVGRAERLLKECPAELRGWEWHHLKSLYDRTHLALPPKESVRGLSFSSDGRRLLAYGNALVLLDHHTGRMLQEWKGYDVASFSPDGKEIVVSTMLDPQKAVIERVDAASGRKLGTVTFDDVVHREVAFADGGRIVALDWFGDGWKVWDTSIAKDRLVERRPDDAGIRANVFSESSPLLRSRRPRGGTGNQTASSHWAYLRPTQPRRISQDGARILTIDGQQGMRVEDTSSGKELARREQAREACLSRDGSRFVCAIRRPGQTKNVYQLLVGEVQDGGGKLRLLYDGITYPDVLEISADGKRLAAGHLWYENNQTHSAVIVFDLDHGRELFRVVKSTIYCVGLSPDGATLAMGDNDGVELWDIASRTRRLICRGEVADAELAAIAWTPEGAFVAVGGRYAGLHVWDVRGRPDVVADSTPQRVRVNLSTSAEGYLNAVTHNGTLWQFDPRTGVFFLVPLVPQAKGVIDQLLAISPDGRLLAGHSDPRRRAGAVRRDEPGRLVVFDLRTGQEKLAQVDPFPSINPSVRVPRAQFNSRSDRLAIAWWNPPALMGNPSSIDLSKPVPAKVQIFDLEKGTCVFEHVVLSQALVHIDFGPGETVTLKWQKAGAAKGHRNLPYYTLELWDTISGKQLRSWTVEWFVANVVSVRDRLVVGHKDGSLQLLDPADPGKGRTLRSSLGEILSLAVSPDGRRLAVGHSGGKVTIWDTQWWREIATLDVKGAPTWSLHFSPDGKRLAAAAEKAITVWSTEPVWTLESLNQALAIREDPEKRMVRGEIHLGYRRCPEAIADFTKALEHKPDDPVLHCLFGLAAYHGGRWELVARSATNLDRLHASTAWWWQQGSMAQAWAGRYKEAAAFTSRLVAIDPQNVEQLTTHAALLLLAGDRDGYRRSCEQVLRRDVAKGDEGGAYHIARICSLAPLEGLDRKKVEALARQAVASGPRAGWNLHALGMVQLRVGQLAEAAETFRKATDAKDWRGQVVNWQALALTLRRQGKHDEAAEWEKKARDWLADTAPKLPAFGVSPFPVHPHDWLEAQLLRRELDEAARDRH